MRASAGMMMPESIESVTASAPSALRCFSATLRTSVSTTHGMIRFGSLRRMGPKWRTFGPPSKHSSQADESRILSFMGSGVQNSRSGSRSRISGFAPFRNPMSWSGVRMGRTSIFPSTCLNCRRCPGFRFIALRISFGITTWYLGDKSDVVIRFIFCVKFVDLPVNSLIQR